MLRERLENVVQLQSRLAGALVLLRVDKKSSREKCPVYPLHYGRQSGTPGKSQKRYKRLYFGTFYQRFVLGKWVASEGLVYPMFDPKKHVYSGAGPDCERYVISCDYGTVNPSSFGLWGLYKGVWYRLKEYYYSSRKEGASRTDEEHYAALEELAGDRSIERGVMDPSAASCIECIRRHGRFKAAKADNDVVAGIRRTGAMLSEGRLMFHEDCRDIIREFSLYSWRDKAGEDAPVKENDHAMDDLRYFTAYITKQPCDEGFFAISVAR